jgi:S1-C subfamily serine protease
MADGEVRRAWLGIGGGPRPLPPVVARKTGRDQGVEIVSVVPGSPAAAAGLRPEDVIVSFDGEPLPDMGVLQRLLTGKAIGRKVRLEIARAGTVLVVDAVPVELSG